MEPKYFDVLKAPGITAAAIASCLGVKPSIVRQMLQGNMARRIRAQGLQVESIAIEGGETEWVLDVNAARFYVAADDSPTGDAYAAHLFRQEAAVVRFEDEYANDDIMKSIAETMALRIRQIRQERSKEN